MVPSVFSLYVYVTVNIYRTYPQLTVYKMALVVTSQCIKTWKYPVILKVSNIYIISLNQQNIIIQNVWRLISDKSYLSLSASYIYKEKQIIVIDTMKCVLH